MMKTQLEQVNSGSLSGKIEWKASKGSFKVSKEELAIVSGQTLATEYPDDYQYF
jgi:hypothetical protein